MNPEIFDKAQRIIKNRRLNALSENERRIDEINEKIPQIKAINEVIFNTGRELIGTIGAGGVADMKNRIERLRRDNLDAQALSRQKLVENGYPPDYLDMHYTCTKCNDTGYSENSMCECFNKLCGKLSAEEMNSHSQLELSSFDTFSLSYYRDSDYSIMKRIFEYLKNYADNFRPDSNSILMSGPTGTGKTHLSLAVANKVLEKGYSVVYDSAINILNEMKREYLSLEYATEMTDSVMTADLLIIDDLGTEHTTAFYTSTVYNIINTRLNRKKPTIISTNLNYGEIRRRYEARIASRITTMYVSMQFSGDDIRLQKKNAKTNRY